MTLNVLPTGEPSPRYECTALGDYCGVEKMAVLQEWWSDGVQVEDITKTAEDYFYDEAGFDKVPFTILSITKIN